MNFIYLCCVKFKQSCRHTIIDPKQCNVVVLVITLRLKSSTWALYIILAMQLINNNKLNNRGRHSSRIC